MTFSELMPSLWKLVSGTERGHQIWLAEQKVAIKYCNLTKPYKSCEQCWNYLFFLYLGSHKQYFPTRWVKNISKKIITPSRLLQAVQYIHIITIWRLVISKMLFHKTGRLPYCRFTNFDVYYLTQCW